MTETHHGSAAASGRGPRVPPAQMRDLSRLRRSTTDRKIAGVAGGIARHLDIDPTVVRVLLVVLVFFGGAGLVVYGAFWLLVPEDGSDEAPIGMATDTRSVALLVVLALAALLLLGDAWWFGFGGGFPPPLIPLLLVGVAVWLLVRNRPGSQASAPGPVAPTAAPGGAAPGGAAPGGAAPGGAAPGGPAQGTGPTDGPPSMPPPPPDLPLYVPPPPPATPPRPPRPRALFGVTLASVLLVLGAIAVVDVAGTDLPWAVYPAAALTVIGGALVTGAFVGRSTGLTFLGLLAAGALGLAVWAPDIAVGEVEARPRSSAQLQDRYGYTAGRVDLDLTAINDLGRLDGRSLEISLRTGEVEVLVPDDLDVEVISSARGGRLDILGSVIEGRGVELSRSTPDTAAPDLTIYVDLGFGQAKVSTP